MKVIQTLLGFLSIALHVVARDANGVERLQVYLTVKV